VVTAQTVVIGTPDQMAASAAALWEKGATLLKVKLDDHLISERLIAIREAVPQATLIVDANEAWHSDGLAERCQLLADIGVAMLEQPLPAGADEALENFIHRCPFAPMRAVIRATAWRRCAGAMRWSISNWIRPAV
jgi:L-alanine-DL-glutamate epimerase-like enolase superfamily enzyme